MKLEWGDEKNKENIRTHGLDFADAWQIFDTPMINSVGHQNAALRIYAEAHKERAR